MSKTFVVGVYNGVDVDDYYIQAETWEEAVKYAETWYGQVVC